VRRREAGGSDDEYKKTVLKCDVEDECEEESVEGMGDVEAQKVRAAATRGRSVDLSAAQPCSTFTWSPVSHLR